MVGNPVSQYIVEVLFQTSGINKALADSRKIEQTIQKYYGLSKQKNIRLEGFSEETAAMKREFLTGAGMTRYMPYYNPRTRGEMWRSSATGKFVKKEEVPAEYLAYVSRATAVTKKYDAVSQHLVKTKEKLEARTKAQSSAVLRLAKRSTLIIPIWAAMRTMYAGVMSTIGDVIKSFADLDNEMGRVGTVTRSVSGDNTRDLKILTQAVLDYSSTASRGFKEAAQVMYALGSGGLTVKEQLAGLQHIMDLSIGTFSNTEQTAKLVTGAYNVFGKSIEGAYTASTKMKRISDVLAYTYSTEQVELSQISDAMTYVASVASLMDISFTELVTTIGVLNTGFLRGSKSGTSLLNAFAQLAKQGGGLSKLGIYFDPSKPLNFQKVMIKLHKVFGSTALSASSLRVLMDTFGRRGGRAVAQLIARFDEWQRAIGDTKSKFEDFALYMRVQAEDTLPRSFTKLWNSIKASGVGNLKGFMDNIKKEMQIENIVSILGKERGLPLSRELKKQLEESYREVKRQFNIHKLKAGLLGPLSIFTKSPQLSKIQQANLLALQESISQEVNFFKEIKNEMYSKGFKGGIERPTTFLSSLDKIASKYSKVKDYNQKIKSIREEINRLVITHSSELAKILDIKKLDEKTTKQLVDAMLNYLSITNKVKKNIEGVDLEYKDYLDNLRKANRIELLKAEGVKTYYIHLQTINDILGDINKAIDNRNEDENEYIGHLQLADIYNEQRLLEIVSKISDQKTNINKLIKEANRLLVDQIKEVEKYSSELKSAFSKNFQDIFSGKIGIGDMFKNVSIKYRDVISKAFSEGLADQLFDITGLDKMFGSSAYSLRHIFEGNSGRIKSAFDYGARKTQNAIITGFNIGLGKGGGFAGFTNYGGYTIGTGAYTLPGFGAGGFFNKPIYGLNYRNSTERAMGARMGYKQAPTYGQVLGVVGSSAMSMYGGMQTGTAAGVLSGLGSLGMGIGMLQAGAATGSIFGAGNLLGASFLGPLGLALAVGGLIAGMFNTPPKWRRESEQTAIKEITSKIDVTNKQLEWVNRNLVALRQELTYIMPRSYYFSFSENDRFAISASRGS